MDTDHSHYSGPYFFDLEKIPNHRASWCFFMAVSCSTMWVYHHVFNQFYMEGFHSFATINNAGRNILLHAFGNMCGMSIG